jgi:probable phosphoglycerate mutase
MGIEVELYKELREHNIGEAVGKTGEWAKANAQPVNSFDDRSFPGAETWREFWGRVSDFCLKVITDEAENIIIVSHGVTLSVWQSVWLGQEIHEFRYSGHPGGVSFMSVDENGNRRIEKLNDSNYMKEQ